MDIKADENLIQSQVEGVGESFNSEKLLETRLRTWDALEKIAEKVRPGMSEEEALAMAKAQLTSLGSSKQWHRTYIRFGENTVFAYGTPSVPGVVLKEKDIFFVDIGPVWDGYEGDAAKTFCVGGVDSYQKCIDDGRRVFEMVKERWRESGESGESLYWFARKSVEALGWRFTLEEANGHRLGDFPHGVHFRGGVSELNFRPSPCHWMLEIQLRHPELPFGSFHEDLLF